MTADETLARLVDRVHAEVVAAGADVLGPSRAELARMAHREAPVLGPGDVAEVVDRVLARVRGLGPLDALLADAAISEVMVNGPGRVWIERDGCLDRVDVELTTADIELVLERILGPLGLRVDRVSPLVDARLPDGSRVNAVVPPLAVDGPCVTIRRFGSRVVELESLTSPAVAALLRRAVRERRNVLVAGGTGAGKTTVLNALAREIPEGERIVTIEDVAELRLDHGHVVRLEARPASVDGVGRISIRDLVRNALRMRPDRIVVGECRGGEALDMLQAMNTGHEGSLSTCHANSPVDALRRIETMIVTGGDELPLGAVREQIRSSIDLVVEIRRGADGRRYLAAVDEVVHEGGAAGLTLQPLAAGRRVLGWPTRPVRRARPTETRP